MALIVKKYSTEPNPSLLLHMDGANDSTNFIDSSLNNFPITTNSAIISTYQNKFGGSAGYFNNSYDNYIFTENLSEFGFGTGDFTIEMWAYKEYDEDYFHGIICINQYDDNGILFRYQPSDEPSDSLYVGNEVYDWNPVGNFPIQQWNHLALVRKDGVVSVYVNGNSVFSVTNTNDLGSSGVVTIGASSHSHYEIFNGYIDEVRIIKGYAAYTSNFVPQNQPFLNPSNISNLIIKKNTTFRILRTPPLLIGLLAYWKLDTTGWIDSSGNGRTLTPVGSIPNSLALINNGASFSSDGSYLSIPYTIAPLNGQKSYSGWVKFNNTPEGYQFVFMHGGTFDQQSVIPFYVESNGTICVIFSDNNSGWTNQLNTNIVPETNIWNHFVTTFNGSTATLYWNGQSVATSQYTGSIDNPDTSSFALGAYPYGNEAYGIETSLDGMIDEVGVWDRALSQEEITSLYNAGAGKTYPFN